MEDSIVTIGSRISIGGSLRLATVVEVRDNGKLRVRWDGRSPGKLGKEFTVEASSCTITDAPAWYISEARWKKKEEKQHRCEHEKKRQELFKLGEVKPRWFCFDCKWPEPLKNKKHKGMIICMKCWKKREENERIHSVALRSKIPDKPVFVPR